MGDNLVEIGIIILLVLLNAVFVAAEIALVSIRPSRVEQLVDDGRRGAKRVRKVTSDPGRFLAVIQLAITFIGFLASAFAGVSLAVALTETFIGMGMAPGLAGAAGLITVTVLLSLFTIVFGELVPKTLALAHPEAFALALAQPVDLLGRVFRPVVAMLTFLTRTVARLFGAEVTTESRITAEELS